MSTRDLLPIFCVVVAGCGSAHHYETERTALLPAPLADEACTDSGSSLTAGAIALTGAEHTAQSDAVGVHVPQAMAVFRAGQPAGSRSTLRFTGEIGLPAVASRVTPGALDAPASVPVVVAGPGFGASGAEGQIWGSMSGDLLVAAIPSRIRRRCLDCYEPPGGADHVASGTKVSLTPVVRMQTAVGLRVRNVRVGGAVALRSQPWLESVDDGPGANDVRVRGTGLVALPGLVVGIGESRARWSAGVFFPQSLGRGPRFGPIAGMSLSWAPRVRAPVAPPPAASPPGDPP